MLKLKSFETSWISLQSNNFLFPAMTLAGKMYFDAMSKIGESAAVSPVSRELGELPFLPSLSSKAANCSCLSQRLICPAKIKRNTLR